MLRRLAIWKARRLTALATLAAVYPGCPSWCELSPMEFDLRDAAARTLIVANLASEESMAVARHYAAGRKIPLANIIYLRTTEEDRISWDRFIEEIFNPLRVDLVARGWIDGRLLPEYDDHGRIAIRASSIEIAYLVTTYGLPYMIANDRERLKKDSRFNTYEWKATHTAHAALDTELALLAMNGSPVVSLIPNDYFRRGEARQEGDRLIKVSRLDGPEASDALRLADDALHAERVGLVGRAYVDRGGPYEVGEVWLTKALKTLRDLPYPTAGNLEEGLAEADERLDGLALYFGWYSRELGGAFRLPDFGFSRGAIAFHIHSFSGRFRDAERAWSGPLIRRGAAVTVGNVAEPYLEQTHHPHLLLEALAAGWPLGDALAYAQPALSWQAMHVGDPLYRPFSTWLGLEEFEKRLSAFQDDEAGYKLSVDLHRARGSGKAYLATQDTAMRVFGSLPSLPLAEALLDHVGGEAANAVAEYVEQQSEFPVAQAGLLIDLAEGLGRHGQWHAALHVFSQGLLADAAREAYPERLRERLLRMGIKAARRTGAEAQDAHWRDELKQLRADRRQREVEQWRKEKEEAASRREREP